MPGDDAGTDYIRHQEPGRIDHTRFDSEGKVSCIMARSYEGAQKSKSK